jgi:predicted hotdog family 3-hydroxylacyl-ACP dehydratase
MNSHDAAVSLEVLDEVRQGDRFEQRLRVPIELACLEGHFPGFPVLPGLAQIRWACGAGEALLGEPVQPVRIEALKFRELLRPGAELSASATLGPDREKVGFELRVSDRTASSGRLLMGAAGVALGEAEIFEPTAEAIPAREVLPHAGPMVFLDGLLAASEKRTVYGVRLDDLPFFRDADGSLPGWAALEPMAQCIAAHGGLEARRQGEAPKVGFLLGCRRLEIRVARLEPGVAYAAAAVQVWGGHQGLVSFDCELFERNTRRRLLAGRINAYLPEDLTAIRHGTLG